MASKKIVPALPKKSKKHPLPPRKEREYKPLNGKDIVPYVDKYKRSGTGGIRKIENLEKLVNLEVLTLHGNGIKKLEGLPENLKILTVGDNPIRVVENLGHLLKLEVLHLSQTAVTSINGGFKGLESLETLFFSDNVNLQSTKGIEDAPNLVNLDLHGNTSMKSLEGIEKLKKMKFLSIKDCGLKNIDSIEGCESLEKIDMSGNEISSLKALKNIPTLKAITLDKEILKDEASRAFLLSLPMLQGVECVDRNGRSAILDKRVLLALR